MTVMKFNRFTENVMPICLPSSIDYPDTNRAATAVGMGVKGERLHGH